MVYYTIAIIRNPQNPILLIEAPIVRSFDMHMDIFTAPGAGSLALGFTCLNNLEDLVCGQGLRFDIQVLVPLSPS